MKPVSPEAGKPGFAAMYAAASGRIEVSGGTEVKFTQRIEHRQATKNGPLPVREFKPTRLSKKTHQNRAFSEPPESEWPWERQQQIGT